MQLLEKALGFNNTTSSLRTEIVAGATTFLTMSYILAVNPAILATTGMDKGAVLQRPHLLLLSRHYYWLLWQNYLSPKRQVWV